MEKILIYGISFLAIGLSIFVIIDFLLNFPFAERAIQTAQDIPIHWHAELNIVIKGNRQIIPSGIGINSGKNIDNHISGMRMSPMHTHDDNGTIHVENSNPKLKPDALTLGYFFYVWEKKFDKNCIFEFCNDGKDKVKFFVNGKENSEFEKYLIKDNDKILIEFG